MLTFIDLFCGGGFGARGAVNGGGRPLLAVDAWETATKTYKENFPDAEVVCSSIGDLDPFEIADRYNPDVLLTSPECTSHSIARGAKPGAEESRATAIGIIPWLEALQPNWVILENVRRMKQWDRHGELLKNIESAGYLVNELFLNAADFGTPQSRKRLFLVCSKNSIRISNNDLLSSKNKKPINAREILEKRECFTSTPLYKDGRASATLERAERATKTLGEGVDFLIVYYGSDYAGGWQSLDVPLRTVTTLDRFGLVTWKNGTPFLRMLQPVELARAMGAGDHDLSIGNRREKIKLCGNGVCSPVLEAIFTKIGQLDAEINQIAKKRYLY